MVENKVRPGDIFLANINKTDDVRLREVVSKLTDEEVHLLTIAIRQASVKNGPEVIQSRFEV